VWVWCHGVQVVEFVCMKIVWKNVGVCLCVCVFASSCVECEVWRATERENGAKHIQSEQQTCEQPWFYEPCTADHHGRAACFLFALVGLMYESGATCGR
jgi:hypothetical protein